MINGDKKIKEMLSVSDIVVLQKFNLSKNDTLKKATDVLEDYLEKKGLTNLGAENIKKEEKKYVVLLKKIYDLLPVYTTPAFIEGKDNNNPFDNE